MNGKYDDIMYLPHHVSDTHPHMKPGDRAAQFAPFAALTGYEEEIKEAARLTEQREEHDETRKAALDEVLQLLQSCISEQPEITVRYFIPDACKDGGSFAEYTGKLKKLDAVNRCMTFTDGTAVLLEYIESVTGDTLRVLQDRDFYG